jgi:formylglycine-generating enzyme
VVEYELRQSNRAPIADPGADLSAVVGEQIALDGSGSVDPDGDQITFAWTEHHDNAALDQLVDETTPHPTFVATQPGIYRFGLTVDDGQLRSDATTVVVSVVQPAAEAITVITAAGTEHEMVIVPEGPFLMGTNDEDARNDEKPGHIVWLSDYYIDRFEVSVAKWNAFASMTGRELRDGDDRMPIHGTGWFEARDYCAWADLRLPTEAEWEKAARGTDGRRFPWGEEIDGRYANFWNSGDSFDNGPSPVGSYPDGVSPYGALDMGGNVWEWVMDWHEEDYYSRSPDTEPVGPSEGEYRVHRGGAWSEASTRLRTTDRDQYGPHRTDGQLGFRCVRKVNPSDEPAFPNRRPVADAGSDQSVSRAEVAQLDGSASYDNDGDPITYEWVQIAGPLLGIQDERGATAGFTSSEIGLYQFSLTVSDGSISSEPDTVSVLVAEAEPQVATVSISSPPDGSLVIEGTLLRLEGSAVDSKDGSLIGASLVWTSDVDGRLGTGAQVTRSLTVGTHVVTLAATDSDMNTSTSSVTITVALRPNTAPVANAGQDQTVEVGVQVILDASASNDPDGDVLTYLWTEGAQNPQAGLVSETMSESIKFIPIQPGVYRFTLEVGDGTITSEPSTVEIMVTLPVTGDAEVIGTIDGGTGEAEIIGVVEESTGDADVIGTVDESGG